MNAEEQILNDYGLSKNESKVYLANLKLGVAKANEISTKANVLRTTTYEVLNFLLQKGLVSKLLKDNVAHFIAVSPKELLNILDEKRKKINESLPLLEELQNKTKHLIRIESFESSNGLKTITNDLLSGKNYTYKVFGGASAWLNFSPSFTEVFYRKKKEQKIFSRAINPTEEKALVKKNSIANSERRFISGMKFTSNCYIYLDKVAFIDYEKENCRGVIIQDKEFNQMMDFFFDKVWEKAKK